MTNEPAGTVRLNGYVGITLNCKQYYAHRIDGKNVVLGYFFDKSLAVAARKEAELQRGY